MQRRSCLSRYLFAAAMSIASLVLSQAAIAGSGDTQPLCMPTLPGCVATNWGQIEPDGIDANVKTDESSAGATKAAPIKMAASPIPVVGGATPSIKTTISPTGLYIGETEKLVAALQRARFNRDGSIAKGEKDIAAAAADIMRKAAGKYLLTLYIKVPQKLRPDESTSLAKKVQAINSVLSGSVVPQT